MGSQQLKPDILERIHDNDELILRIAQQTGKKFRTVEVWCRPHSKYQHLLTVPAVLEIIGQELNTLPADLFEPLKKKVKPSLFIHT
jgi:hypothetical protein